MISAFLAHPEWAGGLLMGALALGAWLAFAWLRGEARLTALLGSGDGERATRGLRDLALWTAFACIAIALVGPRLATERVRVSTSGTDVVFLLDVSRSMEVADLPPDRITHARRIATGMLERLPPESRAALAAFAGRGVVLTPLTPDTSALAEMLPALDGELLSEGGSDLSAGLESAASAFDSASARPRVLVVLSDGEWIEADQRPTPELLVAQGVRVVAFALGSAHGGTVPDHGTPLRDAQGRVVVSRRNEQILVELAGETGGDSFVANEWGEVDLEAALAAILRHSRADAGDGEFIEREVLVPTVLPFALLALLLLLADAGFDLPWRSLARRRRPEGEEDDGGKAEGTGRSSNPWARAALIAPVLLLLAARPVSLSDAAVAQERVRTLETVANSRALTPRELLQLGIAHSVLRHPDAAERALRQAAILSPDPKLAAIALHDLGVVALERGEIELARDRFFDALARNPGQRQSRFNLEWTLAALSEAPPEAPKRKSPDEEDPEAERPSLPEPEAPRQPSEDAEAPPEMPPQETESDGSGEGEAEREGEPEIREAPPPSAQMDAAERDRWLERVEEDPSLALRSAVAGEDERNPRRRRRSPNW